jgi:hypothetical protein
MMESRGGEHSLRLEVLPVGLLDAEETYRRLVAPIGLLVPHLDLVDLPAGALQVNLPAGLSRLDRLTHSQFVLFAIAVTDEDAVEVHGRALHSDLQRTKAIATVDVNCVHDVDRSGIALIPGDRCVHRPPGWLWKDVIRTHPRTRANRAAPDRRGG